MELGFFIYNRLFTVARARVLIIDEADRILLVQHWARGSEWSLPGGGVDTGETPAQAAQRELREELGVELPIDRFNYLATVHVGYEAPLFVLHIQASEIPTQPASPREITEMGWFAPGTLPIRLSNVARLGLAALLK